MAQAETNQNPPIIVRHKHQLEVGDNIFWLLCWVIVSCAALGLAWLGIDYEVRHTKALSNSMSPLETACASSSPGRIHQACLLVQQSAKR